MSKAHAYEFPSEQNGLIVVGKFDNHNEIVVQGIEYSGPGVESLWQQAYNKLLPQKFSPKSALILGFSGGSVAQVIHHHHPKTKITGVEIDPIMINIAQNFFNSDRKPHLKLIEQDAHQFIQKQSSTKSSPPYSLIILDCLLGRTIPEKLYHPQFIHRLKKLGQHVLINHPIFPQQPHAAQMFTHLLTKHHQLQTYHTSADHIIAL